MLSASGSLAYISTYLRKLLSWSTWVIRLIGRWYASSVWMLFSNVFNRFNVLTALSCFVPVWRSMSFRLGLDEHKVRGEHHQVTWEKPPVRGEMSPLMSAVRLSVLRQCFTVSAPGLLDLQTAADPSKAVPCESSWWSWEFETPRLSKPMKTQIPFSS